jgi:molybdopterin molybdotransferase
MHILGLPGNPVSAVVCGILFLVPLIRALLGRADTSPPRRPARFGVAWPANDLREDYLRATLSLDAATGIAIVTPFPAQDSSMVRLMRDADCLLVRPPFAAAAEPGDACEIVDLAALGY